MMELTVKEIQAWLTDFTEKIDENKSYLSELDTPIGDGDHGNNMGRGMTAYQEAFQKEQPKTISDTFKILSMAMISKVGGASGPLYGSAFMNMMKATKDIDVITSQEQLGKIIEEGKKEEVIEEAKEHTKDLVAKKGRASYLGERAIGHIDPGAASSAIFFETLLTNIES